MPSDLPCFVEFAVEDDTRFEALCRVFAAIQHDKEHATFRDEEDWLAFFDDQALAHFWWPTSEESAAHSARWRAASRQERRADPRLWPPSWLFGALFEAFENGDYDLLACRRTDEARGRLEFAPHGFPYGGTECMHLLVTAFGFPVIGEDDGTGYRPA